MSYVKSSQDSQRNHTQRAGAELNLNDNGVEQLRTVQLAITISPAPRQSELHGEALNKERKHR